MSLDVVADGAPDRPSDLPLDLQETDRIACTTCDLLVDIGALTNHQEAHCPRCDHLITRYNPQSFQFALAFSISALVLLSLACFLPFLSLSASGQVQSMDLLDTAFALFQHNELVLGTIVLLLILVTPAMLLTTQSWLLVGLITQPQQPWLVTLGRLLHRLRTWNMVEVFLVSVFVSAAKLSSMAYLTLGPAFWAFIAFVLCTITASLLLDDVQVWRAIRNRA